MGVTPTALLEGAITLAAGCYGLYRIGVWLERRHRERCFICAEEIDLRPRNWAASATYWDSSSNRWAHAACKIDDVERMRQEGIL